MGKGFVAPHVTPPTVPALDLGKPAETAEEYQAQAKQLTAMAGDLAVKIAAMKAAIAARTGISVAELDAAAAARKAAAGLLDKKVGEVSNG